MAAKFRGKPNAAEMRDIAMEKILIRFKVWPVSADLGCSEQAFYRMEARHGRSIG